MLSSRKVSRIRQDTYALLLSPLGWCGIVKGEAGLRRIFLPELSRQALRDRLQLLFPQAVESAAALSQEIAQLKAYFAGRRPGFAVRLDLQQASPFQQRVWAQLRAVPYGTAVPYGWIARKVGAPQAARAVGSALGKNPLPIIIPCHRIVRDDGRLGGFTAPGGAELKAALLRLEGMACAGGRVATMC